jgi:L-iditol 2-dehydrogenase
MKAALLTALRQLEIREAPDPKLTNPRDVRVRVNVVGVCGSDVHYYTTGRIGSLVVHYPEMTGHECAGTVVETGPEVRAVQVGQRVAIDPLIACGKCDQCRAGRSHTCRNQAFLGCPGQAPGALAEYLVMPEECCYPIPGSMSLVQATLIEPFSVGLYAQRMAQAEPGANIAILGSGPIGLCVLLALRAAGTVTTYMTDLIDERLRVAQHCGATWTGNANQQDVASAILKLTPQGMDYVFECAGQQATVDQAVDLLKPGGALLLIGIPETERISFPIHDLRRKELRVLNVRRQNNCVAPAIKMVAEGKVNVDPLVTHNFAFAETKPAFDLVAGYRDGVVKAMVHLSSGS